MSRQLIAKICCTVAKIEYAEINGIKSVGYIRNIIRNRDIIKKRLSGLNIKDKRFNEWIKTKIDYIDSSIEKI